MSLLKTSKNKARAKSQKDKARNSPSQPAFSISNPAPTLIRQAGDGLYLKLTAHQKNIATQIKFITAAVEGNGHTQYRSRHNKTDLTSVVTALLVQLDCAVSTTHQCLTKDILDRDINIKPMLENYEKRMYRGTAFIVRWIDFDSKGAGRELPQDKNMITETIKAFEVALAEVVRLVYECHLQNGTASMPANHQRRSSVDSGVTNTVLRQISGGGVGGALDSPGSGVGAEDFAHRGHPAVEQLRSETMRKTSWAHGGGGSPLHSAFRNKANTLMPVHQSRDSGLSEGSSGGASDEEKRRSGSDHYLSGGQSPEHHHLRDSTSPDWDSNRSRSMTTPIDILGSQASSRVPIPIASPLAPTGPDSSLPPLPGEAYDTPPPLPHREDEEVRGEPRPPLPLKKVSTLPRAMHMNGDLSPEASADQTQGITETDGGNAEELPPPIPIKKRHMSVQMSSPKEAPSHVAHTPSGDDTGPPPIPSKVRGRPGTRASISSPVTTPTHTYRMASHSESMDYPGTREGPQANLPPVPLRMESILGPGVKTVLGQDAPPPKPPRNDRVEVRPSPKPAGSQELEALNAVKKYNEDILKARERGLDELPPPVPLKKKTIMIYKGLVEGYTFDESYVQPLYIPGMDAPPPIPPKKRRPKNKQPPTGRSLSGQSDSTASQKQDTLSRRSGGSKRNSADDNEELEVEVNHLELEDAQGYLIFTKEGGGYTLDGGPVDALIAYAASSAKSVKHFSEAFLLTYSTFITAKELIEKLLYRLTHFYKLNTIAVWQASTSLLVRVLTGLKQSLSKETQVELIDLVHMMITDGNLKFAQILRNALVDKLNKLITENTSSLTLGRSFMTSAQRKSSIMDFSPEAIARQMTILDNELFQEVDVCEMLYWAKEQNEEKSPMLTQFTLHFNNVSQWTKVTLLKRGLDMKSRCKLMNYFIAIMKSLLDSFNNFNSYLAILSAVESSPISRLDWPDKVFKGLEEPRKLIDNRASFKNYREAFAQAKPPCIPYIGLYLQDLTFIEMQPSKLDKDSAAINFTKRWKQFKSVDHIRFAQTKQYNFDPDPELLSLFKNFEVKESDEDLWAISTEIKPSQRNRTH